jgi:hypothetical protein
MDYYHLKAVLALIFQGLYPKWIFKGSEYRFYGVDNNFRGTL